MSQSRRIGLLLLVVVGGIILGAVLLRPLGPKAPASPAGLMTAVRPSSPPPTSAPTQISPTPYAELATLAETLVPQPAVAYPVPAQSETPALDAAYPAPAPSETAAPVSATVGASEGRLAPDFDLVRENGARVRLSDYRGKGTVVVVFFRGQT